MNRILFRTARNIRVPKSTRTPMRRFMSEDVVKDKWNPKTFDRTLTFTTLSGSFAGAIYGYNQHENLGASPIESTFACSLVGIFFGFGWPVLGVILLPPASVYCTYWAYETYVDSKPVQDKDVKVE